MSVAFKNVMWTQERREELADRLAERLQEAGETGFVAHLISGGVVEAVEAITLIGAMEGERATAEERFVKLVRRTFEDF